MSTDSFLKPTLTIPWTPVTDYVERIMTRSELRGWGFTELDACKLADSLRNHDHFGDLYPTSVKLWLGKDLKFNWSELILWVKDGVEALDFEFDERASIGYNFDFDLSFFPGNEMSGEASLNVVGLDLQTFSDPINGILVENEGPRCKRLPGLEVIALLALNPQVYIMMDGKVVPHMISAGLVISTGLICLSHAPCFGHRSVRSVAVDCVCTEYRHFETVMVAFREC